MKNINDLNFKEQKVLIRVDFNVPQDKDLKITDSTRILAAKPTIEKVLKDGGSVILMSHLGRPKGQKIEDLSFSNLINPISDLLGIEVLFSEECVGESVKEKVAELSAGQVMMLENLRFYPEEENGEESFAKELASIADYYVNDAFGTCHRAHASTAIIAQFFGENKTPGYLLSAELESIDKVLKSGQKPITAVIGGAKVSSKITIIENILPVVDNIIIGGGMIFTFVKALGGNIGNSMVEDDKLELAKELLEKAKINNVEVYLPVDVKAADDFKNDANVEYYDSNVIPEGWMGLDVGPKSILDIEQIILNSKTILWNGPLGVFEFQNFEQGTRKLGEAIGKSTENGAFSLVGGGDSVAAVKQFEMEDKVSYVSTGGGAMLESLEGKVLPGVAALMS